MYRDNNRKDNNKRKDKHIQETDKQFNEKEIAEELRRHTASVLYGPPRIKEK